MNTFLSEDDQSLKSKLELFTKEHLAPIADGLEAGTVDPNDFLKLLGESGFLGVSLPKEWGGSGEAFLRLVLLAEALAAFAPSLGAVLANHAAATELILKYGSTEQKAQFLPLLAAGKLTATMAYFEDDRQALPSGIGSSVSKNGDKLVLNGEKRLVMNGCSASLLVTLAKQEDACSFWLIERSAQGVTSKAEPALFGLGAIAASHIVFSELVLLPSARLGFNGSDAPDVDGDKQYGYGMSVMDTILGAVAVGILEEALAEATAYARDGVREGEPLAQSQGVQWKLADLDTEGTAARLITYRAAWSKDDNEKEFLKNAAMSKSFATRLARVHSGEAIQVLGALATHTNTSAAKLYCTAKMLELIGGSNEHQKVLISNELGI